MDGVLAAREAGEPLTGFILAVEHEPVITISGRAGVERHLLATPGLLARHGVGVERTDRGGDITYHGPGQIVLYPILDLNLLNLGLHAYMRLLEESVIRTCGAMGVASRRDPRATGVWVGEAPGSKIAAMGVRVRKWVSMHGLALNVRTNLEHFGLIVPCGLAGRGVTSLERELGETCPATGEIKRVLIANLAGLVEEAWASARERRAGAATG